MPHTTTRPAAVLVALLVLTGCGGSSTAAPAATTAPAVTSAPTTTAPSSATTTASSSAAPAASRVTGEFICGVIRKVQADLPAGSPQAAYMAQFTLGVSELLTSGPDVTSDYSANADARAKQTCPKEYATFLRQSGYANIATL